MKCVLSQNSSRKDISDYIKNFNKNGQFAQAELDELLTNLVCLEIDTYSFSIGANTAAKTIDKKIVDELEKYMTFFLEKEKKSKKETDKAFCAYYLLTYYYRIYEKMDKLANAIALYQSYFEQREERYALAYQIRGRYLRRRGDGSKALDYDRKASELLKKKHIDNIQVGITNASTISIALENRENYITDTDIEDAINVVQSAIISNAEYAKYYYLLAKLKIFSLLYKNDCEKLVNIDYAKEIKEAKELLRTAIELEDTKADSYATSISEYKTYLRSADLVMAEIRLTSKIKSMEHIQADMINVELNRGKQETIALLQTTKDEVDEKVKNAQDKYLEILGVFVSIVAIIMVVIGTFSQEFEITQILAIIIGMCLGILGVYSGFLIMLNKDIKPKYIVTLIISCLLEALLVTISILWL